jgi:hypothetical protein
MARTSPKYAKKKFKKILKNVAATGGFACERPMDWTSPVNPKP